MSRIDAFIQRIPGSVPFKSFVTACMVSVIVAYPVFIKKPEESRQGHDYMSSEKPEIIRSTQEQLRKEYRHQRDEKIASEAAVSTTTTTTTTTTQPEGTVEKKS